MSGAARVIGLTARTLCLALALGAGGCINLPPELERELECPPPGAPDHFGSAATCPAPVAH